MHHHFAIRSLGIVSLLLLAACGDSGSTTTNTTVVSPVAVSAVFPAEARAGETITVSGQRFGATQGTSTLSINGAVATQIASWSDTQIEATVPAGATTGNVTVSVDGVAGAPGHLVVLWQATNPVNVAVSAAAGDQDAPRIIADGAGGTIVVWQDQRNGNHDIYAQRLSSAGAPLWSADGVAVTAIAGAQFAPQLVSDGAGGAIIAWRDQRNGASFDIFGDSDLYAQRLNSAGVPQWAADGVAIATGGRHQSPQLISDGAGGAIIAWTYSLVSGNTVIADDIFAQRVDNAGVPQWTTGGVALALAAVAPSNPQLVSDGAGGAIMVWKDLRRIANSTLTHIFAQRVNGAGMPQWDVDGVPVSDAAINPSTGNLYVDRFRFDPQLVTDGAGGAIVAWQDDSTGNVYVQRIDGAGARQWTAIDPLTPSVPPTDVNISPANPGLSEAQFPQLIPDGAGGAIVAWAEGVSLGTLDVYAQRMNGAGVPQWAAGGVGIEVASGAQSAPQLIPDGEDGAILVWNDARGTDRDIYTQRLNNAGVAQWPTATVISTAVGSQTAPQIVPDGYGGAIVAWQDRRDGNNDIYAQRIGASGRQ